MKTILIPGSKSITNRVLLLSALGRSPVVLHNLLESDDTVYMRRVLSSFGVVFESEQDALRVTPPATLCGDGQAHFIGNAGTVARFVSALCLVTSGSYGLSGVDRMHQRPQADLFTALRHLGVEISCEGIEGFLPAHYEGRAGRLARAEVCLSGQISSQFVSALLLVAPRVQGGLTIEMAAIPPSQPYVEMTLALLLEWNVTFQSTEGGRVMHLSEGLRAPENYTIPADMSGASYPAAWATLCRKPRRILDFGRRTLQGDEQFLSICEHFGTEVIRDGEDCVLRPVGQPAGPASFDFSAMPDVAMTGMILACFYEGRYEFTGLESLRVKECDRISAMVEGFAQLGIVVEVEGDEVCIQGGDYWQTSAQIASLREAKVVTNSYDDHRIAMCFGILRAALAERTGVSPEALFAIGEPHCVAKTWPRFWEDLASWRD